MGRGSSLNSYAAINANATHPNINAILSSQCIARASEYILLKRGNPSKIIEYCFTSIVLNDEYKKYLKKVDKIGSYNKLSDDEFSVLCGNQPIEPPYFLPGISGVPSDSKYTTGAVLYILKHAKNAFDALKKSVLLGGDVDSIASITTGIMAGCFGLNDIPSFMIENIENLTYLESVAEHFSNHNSLKFNK